MMTLAISVGTGAEHVVARRHRPRPLQRPSAVPLWSQLLDDLVRRLEADAFTARFPSEHELMAEYAVSRYTVRESLRRLRESGVIDSNRGRDTVLRQASIEQPLGALYSLFQEVEARGMEQRSEVRALDVRQDGVAADALRLPADTPLVYVERVRFADDEPLAWDRTWLPQDVGAGLLDADLTHSGLYAELRSAGVTLTGGREQIEGVVPSAAQRRMLGTPAGVAALAIRRTGCMRDRPVEWRHTLVRADRFSLSAEWSSTQAYRLDIASDASGATRDE